MLPKPDELIIYLKIDVVSADETVLGVWNISSFSVYDTIGVATNVLYDASDLAVEDEGASRVRSIPPRQLILDRRKIA
jgi:hypothetical protein